MLEKILKTVLFGILYTLMMLTLNHSVHSSGILYPRESETREVKLLDGMWNFRLSEDDSLQGFREKWFAQDLAKVSDVKYELTGRFTT